MAQYSVSIQSVLYRQTTTEIGSALSSLVISAEYAANKGTLSNWQIQLGDCSQSPLLDLGDIEEFTNLVESCGGNFEYIFFGENLGHGGGHNRLANRSGNFSNLVFLNPDAKLAPDSIFEMFQNFGPDIGAADGRQLPLEHLKQYDPSTFDTDWCSGAFLCVDREIFQAIDGFDHSTFFMYCDDVDLSWRIKLAGKRTIHVPSARVFHDKRIDSSGAIVPGEAELYYSQEAAVLLPYKYSRFDISDSVLSYLESLSETNAQKVVSKIEKLRKLEKMPGPIDSDHKVGVFINGGYSHAR